MWQVEMVEKLKAATPRGRASVLQSFAEMTGKSKSYLYEVAKRNGFSSDRKKRADAGTCILTEAMIDFVAGLMRESARQKKGVIMPVKVALEIAIENGIIEHGMVSVGRMQQILAERQLNKAALDAPTPYTDMRSEHPNDVHLIDGSVNIQYYMKNGKTALIDERDFNDKKPENMTKVKARILRYLLTDHFSGLFYVKYYLANGETQKLLYDFLISAWQHKHEEKYPFRGVPFQILWDSASAAKAKAMQHFISGLDIKTPPGRPRNPRRQGSVETTQNIVERNFESRLRYEPAYEIEQLNAWAWDWQIAHNGMMNHTRHGMTRTASWMLIKQAQLRELPDLDVLQALFTTPGEERLVGGNYQISFSIRAGEVKKYWLKQIPGLLPSRSKVLVKLHPYLWPKVNVVYNDISYEVEPLEFLPAIQGGFRADAPLIGKEFKAQPETLTQQAGKRIENYAYGENPAKDAVPYAGITVMGNQAAKLGNIEYMPKRGTAIEFDREALEKQITIMEMIKKLGAAGVEITTKLNKELRAKYGETIDSEEAEQVIKAFTTETQRHGENRMKGEEEAKAEAV